MENISTQGFELNGRTYLPPACPVAVICIDGCADEYLSVSAAKGRMPHLQSMSDAGYRGFVRGALPSFTNVNNSAIVTGLPPSGTGIAGNFFIDPETGEEVMMNSSKYLRADTILAAAANAGREVAMVTAKEKLRDILSKDLNGIAFSSEKADEASEATHGISDVEALVGKPKPEIYSADASVYVLEAGVALVEAGKADFLYLTLTDFMQHKFGPYAEESLDFYEALDTQIGRLLSLGAAVGITADHGMNGKNKADGSPNVIYLESLLKERFSTDIRVICPITDPYVVHHGALGSLVMVHVPDGFSETDALKAYIDSLEGVTETYDREQAVARLELPADRIGDFVVLSGRDWVLGKTPDQHDLSVLKGGLRSHGGRYEEMVPMVLSVPLSGDYVRKAEGDPRNFDIFEFTCNNVSAFEQSGRERKSYAGV